MDMILNCIVTEGLSVEVKFQQKVKRSKGISHKGICIENAQGKGKKKQKL